MELTGKLAFVCREGEARSFSLVEEFKNLGSKKLEAAGIQEIKYIPGGRRVLLLAIRQGMIGEYLAPGTKVVILDDDMDNKNELAELQVALNEKSVENERFSTATLFEKITELYKQKA